MASKKAFVYLFIGHLTRLENCDPALLSVSYNADRVVIIHGVSKGPFVKYNIIKIPLVSDKEE